MTPRLDSTIKRTARLTQRARLRLYWERYSPVLAPGVLAVAIFTIAAWLGLWQWIGDPVRFIALGVTLFFLARSVKRALAVRRPTLSDARRRVEQDSDEAHRPLDVLDDRPALAKDAWPAHQKRALKQAQRLRPARPRAALSVIDPYYLRFAVPVLLLLAAIIMAGFSFERLRQSLSPSWQSPMRAADLSYEAWIDPPTYTGRPPIYFQDAKEVAVPAGSEFVMRISGAKTAPRPRLVQGWRARFLSPTRLGAKSFEVREVISDSATVEMRVGLDRQIWTLNVSPDTPPDVEIIDKPDADKRDRLVLAYGLSDDFGVETLTLEMAELTDEMTEETAFDGQTATADIPLPGTAQKNVEKATAALDLSKNIYAGRKVIGRLIATDGAGQRGMSEPAYFTVPDKIFVEPLAKAVAEHRTLVMAGLAQDYAPKPTPEPTPRDIYEREYEPEMTIERAPAEIQRAALLMDVVTDEPAQIFKDPAVYIGLKHTRSRLKYATDVAELQGVPEDLWKIALRAEFGVLGSALEEMREAEAALREGIARRASKREIDTLFERYNLAVEAYTEELRRKAIEEGNVAEGGMGGGNGGLRSTDEIQELLKAIEEANAAGDTEGARRALARLAEVLENMKIQLTQGGSGGEGGDPSSGGMSEETRKKLEELADLTGQQRDLQDETERAERNDQMNPNEGEGEGQGSQGLSPQELAQRQAEIQDLLDSLDGAIPGQGEAGSEQSGSEDGQSGQGGQSEGQAGQQPGGRENAEGGGDQPGPESGGTGEANAEQGQGQQGQGSGGGRSTQELQEALAEGLEAARRAMIESESALNEGQLGEAGDAQSDAIRALRDAGEALAEAAMREGGRGGEGQAAGENNDPLGRSDDGFNDGNAEADIEDRDNATRSRELLEELRRRAAEQQRKEEERQYLERLLKRF